MRARAWGYGGSMLTKKGHFERVGTTVRLYVVSKDTRIAILLW